jgi:glyoxylase-like metal-dependent hydrolase (beta-lactamase superfamily II)
MNYADSISVRRFGETEIAVVSAGVLSDWVPYFAPGQAWVTPDTDVGADGAAIGGLNWMVVRTKDAIVLIDPATFQPGEVIGRATLAAGIDLDSALRQLALKPEQVTHVIVSHFHPDHVAGLVAHGSSQPRFSNAVHVVPARDWEAFVVNDEGGVADELMTQLGPVQDAGLLRMVTGDEVVAGGISVLHTPGESPGHLCVQIQTPESRVYYLADLVHFPAEIEHVDWIAVRDRPVADLVASRRRVYANATETDTFVYTHGRFPAWGRIEQIGSGSRKWAYLEDSGSTTLT